MDNHTKIEIGVGIIGIGVTLWAILGRGSAANSVQTLPSTSGVALPPPIDLSGGNLDASAGGLLSGDDGSGSGGLTGGLGPSGQESSSGVPTGAVYVGNGIYAYNGLAYIGPNKGPAANAGGDSISAVGGGSGSGSVAAQTAVALAGGSAPPPAAVAFNDAPANTRQVIDNSGNLASPARLALPDAPANNVIGTPTPTPTVGGGRDNYAAPPVTPVLGSPVPTGPAPLPVTGRGAYQAPPAGGGFGSPVPTAPSPVAPSSAPQTAFTVTNGAGPAAPVQAVSIPSTTGGITPAQSFGSPLASGPLNPITRSNVIVGNPRTAGIK